MPVLAWLSPTQGMCRRIGPPQTARPYPRLAAAGLAGAGIATAAGVGGLGMDLLFHDDSPLVRDWTPPI